MYNRKVAVQFKVTQLVSGTCIVVNREWSGVEEHYYSLELCSLDEAIQSTYECMQGWPWCVWFFLGCYY